MDKIDEIVKEFYGQYGYAMHNFQFLERGLLELFALNKYIKYNLTEKEYYIILSNPKHWTLGTIIKEISVFKLFDDSNTELLDKANKNRIFLAHMFWWEREIEFENVEKPNKLHNKIFAYVELCKKLLILVNNMIINTRIENNIKIEEKMGLENFKDREAFIKSLKINNKKTAYE